MVTGVDRALLSSEDRGDDFIRRTRSCRAVHPSDVEDVVVDDDAVGLFALNEREADRRGCHRHTEYELHRPSHQFARRFPLAAGIASYVSVFGMAPTWPHSPCGKDATRSARS